MITYFFSVFFSRSQPEINVRAKIEDSKLFLSQLPPVFITSKIHRVCNGVERLDKLGICLAGLQLINDCSEINFHTSRYFSMHIFTNTEDLFDSKSFIQNKKKE